MDVRSTASILASVLLLCGCTQPDTENYVDVADWSPTVSVSLAMSTLSNVVPDSVPDNTPEPDPDPAKCPCKGTGVITHGDGHETPCPYHDEDNKPDVPHKCQCDTKRTYCNCKAAYGECSCDPQGVKTSVFIPTRPQGFLGRLFGSRR